MKVDERTVNTDYLLQSLWILWNGKIYTPGHKSSALILNRCLDYLEHEYNHPADGHEPCDRNMLMCATVAFMRFASEKQAVTPTKTIIDIYQALEG